MVYESGQIENKITEFLDNWYKTNPDKGKAEIEEMEKCARRISEITNAAYSPQKTWEYIHKLLDIEESNLLKKASVVSELKRMLKEP